MTNKCAKHASRWLLKLMLKLSRKQSLFSFNTLEDLCSWCGKYIEDLCRGHRRSLQLVRK